MCGIAGCLNRRPWSEEALQEMAWGMSSALSHRGPDDAGTWVDVPAHVALGHRRLTIVDLTARGRQPFVSRCGRFVLCYNGELYNHRSIRTTLAEAGVNFRSTSDTEVLVESISMWGVEETVNQSNGMFAFAVWDRGSSSRSVDDQPTTRSSP